MQWFTLAELTGSQDDPSKRQSAALCLANALPPGLDPGDRQVLEQKYSGCDPTCLLDSSDGRYHCELQLASPHHCHPQVCLEGCELQSSGCDELLDDQKRIQGGGRSSAEDSA